MIPRAAVHTIGGALAGASAVVALAWAGPLSGPTSADVDHYRSAQLARAVEAERAPRRAVECYPLATPGRYVCSVQGGRRAMAVRLYEDGSWNVTAYRPKEPR